MGVGKEGTFPRVANLRSCLCLPSAHLGDGAGLTDGFWYRTSVRKREQSLKASLGHWGNRVTWSFFGGVNRFWGLIYRCSGRSQVVDTLVYKVDRLGDWFLAEPTLERVAAAHRLGGKSLIVLASRETDALRAGSRPGFLVESVVFEPKGARAKLRRGWNLAKVLARYRPRTLLCLRYSPEPVRDFVLKRSGAGQIVACSWRIVPGAPDQVPHEIRRHQRMLEALGGGVAPNQVGALLPARARMGTTNGARRLVLAPFSSSAVKDWREDSWRQLVPLLLKRGYTLEVWVGPDQVSTAREQVRSWVADGADASRAHVCSGSLQELEAAVASSAGVISVDTFAAHLAVAYDLPMVGLLGGGQFGDFAPWTRTGRQRWLTHPVPCFHCNWRCHRPTSECVKDIPVSAVVAAFDAVMAIEPSTVPAGRDASESVG